MYPKSIYKDGQQIVVWCGEEHAARTAEGWSDDKQVEPDVWPPLTLRIEGNSFSAAAIPEPTPERAAKPKTKSAKKA